LEDKEVFFRVTGSYEKIRKELKIRPGGGEKVGGSSVERKEKF